MYKKQKQIKKKKLQVQLSQKNAYADEIDQFSPTFNFKAWLWMSDSNFPYKILAFCVLYCQNFRPRMSWNVKKIQPTSQDVATALLFKLFFEDYFMFSTNIEYIPQDSIL